MHSYKGITSGDFEGSVGNVFIKLCNFKIVRLHAVYLYNIYVNVESPAQIFGEFTEI